MKQIDGKNKENDGENEEKDGENRLDFAKFSITPGYCWPKEYLGKETARQKSKASLSNSTSPNTFKWTETTFRRAMSRKSYNTSKQSGMLSLSWLLRLKIKLNCIVIMTL